MDAWQGAQNTLYLATSNEAKAHQGQYFTHFYATQPTYSFPEDPDVIRDWLWNESCRVVERLGDGYSYERCLNLSV